MSDALVIPRFMRAALSAVAPPGQRFRLSTLIFHRVLEAPDPLAPGEVTQDDFTAILGWCKQLLNVLPLPDAVAKLKASRLPSRPLVITFDDGYADNHDVAAPILRRLDLPATFFVASGYLDGGCMFNDKVAAAVGGCSSSMLDLSVLGLGRHNLFTLEDRRKTLARLLPAVKVLVPGRREDVVDEMMRIAGVLRPPSPMMTSDQVASLKRQGFEIGAHTESHPILASIDDDAARREIDGSRMVLQGITNAPVRYFAYPNGRPGDDFTARTVHIVRQLGFEAAFATAPGVSGARSDLFQLPRFTPWDRSPSRFALRMFRNLMNDRSLTAEAASADDRSLSRTRFEVSR